MENNILFEIKKVEHLAIQKLMKGKDLGKHPSPTQIRIIIYMMKNKDIDIYQKDLEHHLNISRATISNVLDTMEKNGIIERFSDEIDTRTKKVKITKKTIEMHNEAKKEVENLTQKILENISRKDLKIFIKVLKQIEDNLK